MEGVSDNEVEGGIQGGIIGLGGSREVKGWLGSSREVKSWLWSSREVKFFLRIH
jgi:hypothetical protein